MVRLGSALLPSDAGSDHCEGHAITVITFEPYATSNSPHIIGVSEFMSLLMGSEHSR
jgi:hypothetical protein